MFTGGPHRIQRAAVSHVWASDAKGDGSAHVMVTGGEVIITPREAVPEDGLDGAITTPNVRAVIAPQWGPALTDVQAAITREALLKMTFAGDVTLDLDALARTVYPERQFGIHGKHLTAAEMREAVLSQVRALAAMTIRADEPVGFINRGGKRVKLEWDPTPMFWVVRCQRDEQGFPWRVEVQASPSMRRRLQIGGQALPGIGTRRQFFPYRQAAGAWAYVMRDVIAEHLRFRTRNLRIGCRFQCSSTLTRRVWRRVWRCSRTVRQLFANCSPIVREPFANRSRTVCEPIANRSRTFAVRVRVRVRVRIPTGLIGSHRCTNKRRQTSY